MHHEAQDPKTAVYSEECNLIQSGALKWLTSLKKKKKQ